MKEKNNFDIVRLILAFTVLLVHSAEVSRNTDLRFLAHFLNSDFAVKGFFAISGFLIAKSYMRSQSLRDYAVKRCKRILPAYIFTIIMCLFIGAAVTSLPLTQFIVDSQTLKYMAANFSFMNFIQPSLPGVFTHNPNQPIDGSLWTIKAEITLYALLPFALFFMKRKPLTTWFVIYLISCLWFWFFIHVYSGAKADALAKQFVGLSGYFFFGTLLSVHQASFDKLKEIAIVSLIAYFLTKDTQLSLFVEPVAFSSVVLLFCTGMFKEVPIGKYGDFSYGIYLYHWPIIQLLIHFGVYEANPLLGVALTIMITLLLAVLSWNLLESRFLKRKSTPNITIKPTIV